MLIALIIVSVIAIGVILLGWLTDNTDLAAIGVMFTIAVGLFGWVMLGNLGAVSAQTTEVSANVLQDKNATHLSVNDVIVATYNDVATVKYLADKETVKVVKTTKINMYGSAAFHQHGVSLINNHENSLL